MNAEKRKTIETLCGREGGSFRKHIYALDIAAKLGLARLNGPVTLSPDEIAILFQAVPELEKFSIAAIA